MVCGMNAIRNLLLRLAQCSSGAAIVEATLVMPILISLMAGGLEFGRAYWASSTADKSMRDAARYLARVPQADVCTWGLTKATNLAVYGNLGGTGNPLISGWSTTNVTLQQPSDCGTSFTVIQLQATVPFTALTWSVVGLSNSITMHVRHQERWIGE
jgi:Flp pilus assembly protein TadG